MKASSAQTSITNARRRRHRWRPFFWRWHRRLGVVAALIVLLVSVTGLLLNHTAELKFGSLSVRQGWLLSHYGMSPPEAVSYQVGNLWISGDERNSLYWDGEPLASCQGELKGALAVASQQGLHKIVACAGELLVFTESGELVERIGSSYGLPQPVDSIGSCGEAICLRSGDQILLADLQRLHWRPVDGRQVEWVQSRQSPAPLQQKLLRAQGSALSWERVLLDLHSGRILGQVGVWIVDLAALLLLFLALSGFWLWYQHLGRRRRP